MLFVMETVAFKVQMTLVFVVSTLCTTETMRTFPQSREERLHDVLFNQGNYNQRVRPVFNPNDTVHVRLKMQVYTMVNLNERDEIITTASWINLEWQDMRLSWDPSEFDDLNNIVLDVDEIWTPKIFLSNSVSEDSLHVISRDTGSITLWSEGRVELGTPFVQSTHCPLQVRYFPFDTQVCQFYFLPVNQLYKDMALSAYPSDNPPKLESLQWDLLNSTVKSYVNPFYDPNKDGNLSYFTSVCISLYLQRNPSYYVSNIIIPSTFMCCLAFATFLAAPESGERISLGVSMVLGLTVFQLLISDTLPTSSKQSPILSNYLAINFILACSVVPLSLVNINVACMDKAPKILRYGWVKKVFMDCLPCYLFVSTTDHKTSIGSIQFDSSNSTFNQNNLEPKDEEDERVKEYDVHPMTVKHDSATTKQVHVQNRTLAVVMDRLFFICFLVAFSVSAIQAVVEFSRTPDVSFAHNDF